MGMRQQLDPVEPALLTTTGGGGEILHHARHILALHHLWKRPVRPLAPPRRANDRQPMPVVPGRAPPHMGDLAHDGRAMGFHPVRQPLEPRHDAVIARVKLPEDRGAVGRDIGRSPDHGHPDPALGLFLVVEPVAVARVAIFDKVGGVGGRDDAVADRQVAQAVRLQQGVARHINTPGSGHRLPESPARAGRCSRAVPRSWPRRAWVPRIRATACGPGSARAR